MIYVVGQHERDRAIEREARDATLYEASFLGASAGFNGGKQFRQWKDRIGSVHKRLRRLIDGE